ncbi:MAG: DUF192 domain-containing protein [Anaerolineales bacterium]|nr:DUF192 domain-containing protein [Anaerolineales bacterium]
MKRVHITNQTRPLQCALQARYCADFPCRLRGLTFRRTLAAEQGLLLVQERENRLDAAIHMLFVCMDLAVIWIDAEGRVVDRCLAKAWRPMYVPRQAAQYVLEIIPTRLAEFEVGDRLKFEDTFLD